MSIVRGSLLLLLVSLAAWKAHAEQWTLSDPAHGVSVEVRLSDDTGIFSYRLSYEQQPMLDWSALGLQLEGHDLSQGLRLIDANSTPYRDQYALLHGKQKSIDVSARRLDLELENSDGIRMSLDFHLQHDGLAFRYRLPEQKKLAEAVRITAENSGFKFPRAQGAWMQEYAEPSMVGPGYELFYEKVSYPIG